MPRDIAAETLKVGNALASVKIDQMILNLAKGIAWGQYELDKVGVDITKMMGAPGMVTIGDEELSMLEAGFVPSFYHFVDTILELKMEVNIREEVKSSTSVSEKVSRASETETSVDVATKTTVDGFFVSAEVSTKFGYRNKSTSAYSRTVDAKHSQTYSQDLSATSLMRTKLVPVPAPELLVERIRILVDRMREEAVEEAENEEIAPEDFAAEFEKKLVGKIQEKLFNSMVD